MTHTMTDNEYQQYLKNMEELAEFRDEAARIPERIRSYFYSIKNHIEKYKIDTSFPVGFVIHNSCSLEKSAYGYCDMCPAGAFFYKCPLGKSQSYSQ